MNPLLPNAILGLFSYLDHVLDRELVTRIADIYPHEFERKTGRKNPHSPIMSIETRIRQDVRFTERSSKISEALDLYKIYHEDDAIHALSWAYCLYRCGKSPNDAFLADYSVKGFGMLQWAERADDKERVFAKFERAGDRYVAFSNFPSTGLLLIRGDRLVAHLEPPRDLLLTDVRVPQEYVDRLARFEALGGCKAFLNGKFEWQFTD